MHSMCRLCERVRALGTGDERRADKTRRKKMREMQGLRKLLPGGCVEIMITRREAPSNIQYKSVK